MVRRQAKAPHAFAAAVGKVRRPPRSPSPVGIAMPRRSPGSVTRLVIATFHRHPEANAVEIGKLTGTATTHVCSILRANGLSTAPRRPRPLTRAEYERRRLARIDSDPVAREARLARRRAQWKASMGDPQRLAKERARNRKRMAEKRADDPEFLKRERERERLAQGRRRAAKKAAKQAALELAAQLPKARIRSEDEILAEARERRARRMRQRQGEGHARNEYQKHLAERMRV
jgi:hypothetical protein